MSKSSHSAIGSRDEDGLFSCTLLLERCSGEVMWFCTATAAVDTSTWHAAQWNNDTFVMWSFSCRSDQGKGKKNKTIGSMWEMIQHQLFGLEIMYLRLSLFIDLGQWCLLLFGWVPCRWGNTGLKVGYLILFIHTLKSAVINGSAALDAFIQHNVLKIYIRKKKQQQKRRKMKSRH